MHAVRLLLQKKPFIFLLGTLVYLLAVYLIKWNIHPTWSAFWFFAGSLVGTYFLEAAEEFFHLAPSPFRSIVFVGLFALVSLFVVSSSGSFFASGLVLAIFLTLLFLQIGEWATIKNINRWYSMIADPVSPAVQLGIMVGTMVVFFAETLLFLRGA